MERINFNWDTTHDTANDVMTHRFVKDIACIVNFKRAILTITRKGRTIDVLPLPGRYTVKDHFDDIIYRISAIAHGRFFQRRRLLTLCHELRNL
jgi:hypothetical protein